MVLVEGEVVLDGRDSGHRPHAVQEFDAVEMVDLVLDDPGGVAVVILGDLQAPRWPAPRWPG